MPRLPDSYWSAKRRGERNRRFAEERGGRVIDPPHLNYDVAFVRSEIDRYYRDWRDFYEGPTANKPDRTGGWNPNGQSILRLYRIGMMQTFGWFLGMYPSVIHGHPGPPTEETFRDEELAAYVMEADTDLLIYNRNVTAEQVYGEFEPWTIRAVHKTLRWVTADDEQRENPDYARSYDPITW